VTSVAAVRCLCVRIGLLAGHKLQLRFGVKGLGCKCHTHVNVRDKLTTTVPGGSQKKKKKKKKWHDDDSP
jgi:hypothetical protein